jgi:hypothetical protein
MMDHFISTKRTGLHVKVHTLPLIMNPGYQDLS